MPNESFSLRNIKIACSNCSLGALCLPYGLDGEDIDRLDDIVKRNHPYQRNEFLFSPGQNFKNLYVVKTGAVKTYVQDDEGQERVIGFHLPGEILGLDAIESNEHSCFAKALETTAVCEMPFERLEDLSKDLPSLQHQMLRLMSREVSNESQMIALLNHGTAEERLASFIVSLAERFQRRGFSSTDFFLPMSRQDIGSYLGLALETVSRLFTRFQELKLLKVERKHIEVLDMDALRRVISHKTECQSVKAS